MDSCYPYPVKKILPLKNIAGSYLAMFGKCLNQTYPQNCGKNTTPICTEQTVFFYAGSLVEAMVNDRKDNVICVQFLHGAAEPGSQKDEKLLRQLAEDFKERFSNNLPANIHTEFEIFNETNTKTLRISFTTNKQKNE